MVLRKNLLLQARAGRGAWFPFLRKYRQLLDPVSPTLSRWIPRRPTPGRQFRAVLRKNLLLQARGGRALCGLGGGAALVVEVLTPALFFLVMCLPKYYLPVTPTRLPAQLFPAADLDTRSWARDYAGALLLATGVFLFPELDAWPSLPSEPSGLSTLDLQSEHVTAPGQSCLLLFNAPTSAVEAMGVRQLMCRGMLDKGRTLYSDPSSQILILSCLLTLTQVPAMQALPRPLARPGCSSRPIHLPRPATSCVAWLRLWPARQMLRASARSRGASMRCSAAKMGRSACRRPAAWRRPPAGRACWAARSLAMRLRCAWNLARIYHLPVFDLWSLLPATRHGGPGTLSHTLLETLGGRGRSKRWPRRGRGRGI